MEESLDTCRNCSKLQEKFNDLHAKFGELEEENRQLREENQQLCVRIIKLERDVEVIRRAKYRKGVLIRDLIRSFRYLHLRSTSLTCQQ